MMVKKTSILVAIILAGAAFGNVGVIRADDTTTTAITTVQNDTTLTLAGDAIAVQKLKLGKTMSDKTSLVKIYYVKAGATLKLEGPFADLGGYTVAESSALPKIDTAKYAYVLNDEGLSQDGQTLNHKDPATDISKDEPTFDKYSKKWVKKLTKAQVKSIDWYSKNYGDMNNYLRGIDKKASKTTKANIKRVDAAFKSFKNPKQTTVWRGLSTDGFKAGLQGDLKVGSTYKDKGYMSATFDKEIAKKYAAGVILQITLPKGKSTGAYIGNISSWKIEKEYLIKHGSSFKITAIDDLGDNQLISMSYVK
jgi:hypothetical protein